MPTLSVCMIVRNESALLGQCLASVAGLADEVIVVDTGSTDDTIEIARNSGARVYPLPWRQDFAAARNYSLEQATGDFILVLDADERLVPHAAPLIRALMAHGPNGYELRIMNFLSDAGAEDAMEHFLIRLFPNRGDLRYQGVIHEQLVSQTGEPLQRMVCPELLILHEGYRAEVVEAQGKQARNKVLLEQAVAAEPGNAFHHFNLAQNQLNGGDPAAAIASFQTCVELAPDDAAYVVPAWVQLIGLTAEHVSPEAAGDLMVAAPEACQANPDFWIARGGVCLMLGEYAEAIAAYEQAAEMGQRPLRDFSRVDRSSMTWKPYAGIANVWIVRDYPETAVLYLRTALAACPVNPMIEQKIAELERDVPWLRAG